MNFKTQDSETQFKLGKHYEPSNKAKAIECYKMAAAKGHSEAQFELGNCHSYICGKNEDVAMRWYTKAALQGHVKAQYTLATRYFGGLGVERNTEKGYFWLVAAANQGYAEAQSELAAHYKLGSGIVQDKKKAVELFTLAANQGYTPAQRSLGQCYYFGDGVTQDKREAFKWYQLSGALYDKSHYYHEGVEVEINVSKAITYFSGLYKGTNVETGYIGAIKHNQKDDGGLKEGLRGARVAARNGDEKAKDALEKVWAVAKKRRSCEDLRVLYHQAVCFWRGELGAGKRDRKTAIELFRRAAHLEEFAPRQRYRRGGLNAKLGRAIQKVFLETC